MTFRDILNLRSCKNGDELFGKVAEILSELQINVYDEDGEVKDLYDLCCDVTSIWSEEK